ncbi:MAG: hypothetical protein AAB473_03405 [Patescibacteria group bacterium]
MIDDINEISRTIVHEAGHATVGVLLFPDEIVWVSAIPNPSSLGRALTTVTLEMVVRYPTERFIDYLAFLFAGRAAEENRFSNYKDWMSRHDEQSAHEALHQYRAMHPKLLHNDQDLTTQARQRAHEILVREQSLFHTLTSGLVRYDQFGQEWLLYNYYLFATT